MSRVEPSNNFRLSKSPILAQLESGQRGRGVAPQSIIDPRYWHAQQLRHVLNSQKWFQGVSSLQAANNAARAWGEISTRAHPVGGK
jgi:hypothetical protein